MDLEEQDAELVDVGFAGGAVAEEEFGGEHAEGAVGCGGRCVSCDLVVGCVMERKRCQDCWKGGKVGEFDLRVGRGRYSGNALPRPMTETPVTEEKARAVKSAACVMVPGWWQSALGSLGLARKTFSLTMGPKAARRPD